MISRKFLSGAMMSASVLAFSQSVDQENIKDSIDSKNGIRGISELVISAQKKLEVNKLNIKNIDAPMTVNVVNKAVLQKWDINNIEEASKM